MFLGESHCFVNEEELLDGWLVTNDTAVLLIVRPSLCTPVSLRSVISTGHSCLPPLSFPKVRPVKNINFILYGWLDGRSEHLLFLKLSLGTLPVCWWLKARSTSCHFHNLLPQVKSGASKLAFSIFCDRKP